jgi:hypothetical protein
MCSTRAGRYPAAGLASGPSVALVYANDRNIQGDHMRKIGYAAAVVAIALAGACSKTDEGDVVVERPGEIDVKTTKDTIKTPDMPDVDVNMKKDTVIVNRPSVTVKPDSVKRP